MPNLVEPLCLFSQATYVLLALAWVFVPVYISSGVSSHTSHEPVLSAESGSACAFQCQVLTQPLPNWQVTLGP